MKTIFKYTLTVKDIQTISIPEGAGFLSVIEQNNLPVIYFLVDPNQESQPVTFVVLGTGRQVEEDSLKHFLYLGTVSTLNTLGRNLVWHIFAQESTTWSKR